MSESTEQIPRTHKYSSLGRWPGEVDSDGVSGLMDKLQLDESVLTKILVNAVKEQQYIIMEQQQQLEELKKQNERMKSSNAALGNDLNELKVQMDKIQNILFQQVERD